LYTTAYSFVKAELGVFIARTGAGSNFRLVVHLIYVTTHEWLY